MIRRIFVAVTLLVLAAAPSVFANDGVFLLDASHTRVGFTVRHMVISNVNGNFGVYSGYFTMDDKGALTYAEATVDVASINTEDKKRDDHLRSPDFFDVKTFPKLTFVSQSVTHEGSTYTVVGNLTMKGVTKSVTLNGELIGVVTDPWGNERAGFNAKGIINRKDFGVNFNKVMDNGGVVVGDEVTIILDIEGIKTNEPIDHDKHQH